MKTSFFLFVSVLLFISCSEDDTVAVDSALDGKWILSEVSCFCFFDEDFDFSQHALTFESASQEITVENSINTFFITPLPGIYPYTVNDTTVRINNDREYRYEITGNMLVLTFIDNPNIADDEITLRYNKEL